MMTPITTTAELAAFCDKIKGQPFVAVDTEFMRETTYWPKLCLIQAAAGSAEACIDPLAEGIDPELGFRMIRVESGFEPRARGAMGAAGLLQLMPSTARTIDRTVDTRKELLDPATNLRLGFHYLREMIERYDGDVRLGVLAYNRGEIAVDRALKRGRDPENGYSHKVLGTRSSAPYKGHGLVEKAPKK